MQFAPDGEHIATTGGDGAIRVWSWRADRLGEPPPNGESLTMLGSLTMLKSLTMPKSLTMMRNGSGTDPFLESEIRSSRAWGNASEFSS